MNFEALVDLSVRGLWTALTVLIPLVVVAALAGVVAGALSSRLGIPDGAPARLARVLAVAATLAVAGGWMTRASVDFALSAWDGLGAAGRSQAAP